MPALVALQLVCCTHHREKEELEHTFDQMQCGAALRKDPFQNFTEVAAETSEHLGKKAMAYTYVAGNYTAEVLWDVTAGVVLFVGLCAPIVAVAVAAKGNVHGSFSCLPGGKKAKALFAPPLGRQSLQKTQSWRCPNYEPLVETLHKVLLCHQQKDSLEDMDKALQTLDNLESSGDFYDCLTNVQKLSLQNRRLDLRKRRAELQNLPQSL